MDAPSAHDNQTSCCANSHPSPTNICYCLSGYAKNEGRQNFYFGYFIRYIVLHSLNLMLILPLSFADGTKYNCFINRFFSGIIFCD